MKKREHGFATMAALLLFAASARADEIASNGVGGGPWSDPATWHAKKVPGPLDEVVIQKNDIVIFDRSDDDKVTCKKLLIDPKGGFTFQPRAGKLIFTVREGIESFGVIRMDGTKSPKDDFELRLAGDTPETRVLKLGKGAALLAYGHPERIATFANVAISAVVDTKASGFGLVEAEGVVMIDWLRVRANNIKLVAKKIDNTGAKPSEKIRLIDNRFSGLSRIVIAYCDTPEITKNVIDAPPGPRLDEAAINVAYSPLAEIKNNVVKGNFAIGITVNYQGDSVLIGNVVEKCGAGITGGYGIPNTMIKDTTIRDCEFGLKIEGASGILEDVVVEGATVGFFQQNGNLQLTNFVVKKLADKGAAAWLQPGTLSLLNCLLEADQVVVGAAIPAKRGPLLPQAKGSKSLVAVRSMKAMQLAVKGAPEGSLAEVRSSAAIAGAADLNVRNSPAPIFAGRTPQPKTLTPLIVQAWALDAEGNLIAPLDYTVTILGPAPKDDAERPLLKTQMFRAADLRPGTDGIPTIEVNLP